MKLREHGTRRLTGQPQVEGVTAEIVQEAALDGISSFDTNFDSVAGVRRVEP